jgi:hypothetical protein
VTLLGETNRGNTTVAQWLDNVLDPVADQSFDDYIRPMHAAVSYVLKVFLFMALKQARHRVQRTASLYNGILIGREFAPAGPLSHGAGGGRRRTGAAATSGCGRTDRTSRGESLFLWRRF